MVQPALQDEPRRSRGVLGPSLAENRPKTRPPGRPDLKHTSPKSGQTAFRYPVFGAQAGPTGRRLLPSGVPPRGPPVGRGSGPLGSPGLPKPTTAAISAMCACVLGVRALLISVFCCFGPFCGRGRPQDSVERNGLQICCRNQGSLPSGIGSEAILWGGGPPRGSSLCHTKNGFVFPSGP